MLKTVRLCSAVGHEKEPIVSVCFNNSCAHDFLICGKCMQGKHHGHSQCLIDRSEFPFSMVGVNTNYGCHYEHFQKCYQQIYNVWELGNQVLQRFGKQLNNKILSQFNLIWKTMQEGAPREFEEVLKYDDPDTDPDQVEIYYQMLKTAKINHLRLSSFEELLSNAERVSSKVSKSIQQAFLRIDKLFKALQEKIDRYNIFELEQKEDWFTQDYLDFEKRGSEIKQSGILSAQSSVVNHQSSVVNHCKDIPNNLPLLKIQAVESPNKEIAQSWTKGLVKLPQKESIPSEPIKRVSYESELSNAPQGTMATEQPRQLQSREEHSDNAIFKISSTFDTLMINSLQISRCRVYLSQNPEGVYSQLLLMRNLEYLQINDSALAQAEQIQSYLLYLPKLQHLILSCQSELGICSTELIKFNEQGDLCNNMTRIEYFYDFYTNLELWDVTITFPNYNPNFKVCEQQQMPDREMKRITKADFMPRIVLSFELVCELVTRLHLRNIWLTDINKIGGINRKKETNVLPIPKEFEQIEYLTFGYYDTVRSIPQQFMQYFHLRCRLKSLTLIRSINIFVLGFVNDLKRQEQLEVLVIDECPCFGNQQFIGITLELHCKQLRKLYVSQWSVSNVEFLKGMAYLRTLILPNLEKTLIIPFERKLSLSHLALYGSKSDIFQLLRSCDLSKIVVLNIGNNFLSRNCLQLISQMSQLRKLCIDGYRFTEEQSEAKLLPIAKNLNSLSMAHCSVTNFLATFVKELANLNLLDIRIKSPMIYDCLGNLPTTLKDLSIYDHHSLKEFKNGHPRTTLILYSSL